MEHSEIDLADVVAFLRVAETGSFARAAERLGASKSIVSRRVARLEATLAARLLTRTARGASPTDVGNAYYARAVEGLAYLDAAREAVAEAVADIAGTIRLAAPWTFGAQHLAPVLAEFLKAHPRVELDVSFDDRVVDLVGGGFDVGVRIGTLPDSSLIARRLAPVRRVVVGAPSYLAARGRPEHPDDLAQHDLLFYANATATEQWRFQDNGRPVHAHVSGRLRADSGEMLREAAVAGLGLAILPTFIASAGIASGALEVVLSAYTTEEGGLYAIMPPGRATTARVRALVNFLAAQFGPEPKWDPCWNTPERNGGTGPSSGQPAREAQEMPGRRIRPAADDLEAR